MDADRRLVVMTANIGDGLADPLRIAADALASGVDLVGFQEVSARQADALLKAFEETMPHAIVQGQGIHGKAVFSRYPLLQSEPLEIVSGRPDLMTLIDAPGGAVRVVVAHPEPPRFGPGSGPTNILSGEQIRRLADAATSSGEAGLLLGDLNRVSWQRAARAVRDVGMIDAWLQGGHGPGFTLPTRWAAGAYRDNPLARFPLPPVARVDYVWHTPHFETEHAWMGDPAGSDHRPVLARLVRRNT